MPKVEFFAKPKVKRSTAQKVASKRNFELAGLASAETTILTLAKKYNIPFEESKKCSELCFAIRDMIKEDIS